MVRKPIDKPLEMCDTTATVTKHMKCSLRGTLTIEEWKAEQQLSCGVLRYVHIRRTSMSYTVSVITKIARSLCSSPHGEERWGRRAIIEFLRTAKCFTLFPSNTLAWIATHTSTSKLFCSGPVGARVNIHLDGEFDPGSG